MIDLPEGIERIEMGWEMERILVENGLFSERLIVAISLIFIPTLKFSDSYMGVISSILIPILRFSACSRIGIQRIQRCSHHSSTVDTRRDT